MSNGPHIPPPPPPGEDASPPPPSPPPARSSRLPPLPALPARAQGAERAAAGAGAKRAPRMSLASITTKKVDMPVRLLVHGVVKIGKTTLAANAPRPIFICPEDGIPPDLAGTAHWPSPEGGWLWQDVVDAVRLLATEKHRYKTLVIDTLDWIEPLLWKEVCQRNNWESLDDAGFGNGWKAATAEWRLFRLELEQLWKAGMNVIVLAHTAIRSFKDPTSDGWDMYEIKVHKGVASLFSEWCDAVLFANHEQVATKDARTKRSRGVSTGERLLYCHSNAAYIAGNRFNLPETLPLSWEALAHAMREGPRLRLEAMRAALVDSIENLLVDDQIEARKRLQQIGDNAAEVTQLQQWVHERLQTMPPPPPPPEDLPT